MQCCYNYIIRALTKAYCSLPWIKKALIFIYHLLSLLTSSSLSLRSDTTYHSLKESPKSSGKQISFYHSISSSISISLETHITGGVLGLLAVFLLVSNSIHLRPWVISSAYVLLRYLFFDSGMCSLYYLVSDREISILKSQASFCVF